MGNDSVMFEKWKLCLALFLSFLFLTSFKLINFSYLRNCHSRIISNLVKLVELLVNENICFPSVNNRLAYQTDFRVCLGWDCLKNESKFHFASLHFLPSFILHHWLLIVSFNHLHFKSSVNMIFFVHFLFN